MSDRTLARGPVTRRRTLVLATALAAGAAGCAGDGGDGGDDTGTGDGATDEDDGGDDGDGQTDGQTEVRGELPTEATAGVTVAMETEDGEEYFDPEVSWVTPGSTVTFANESGAHSTTAYAQPNDRPNRIPEDAEAWDSGTLTEEGAEFEHTFDAPGVYDYYCIPHETMGMLGTVIVGEPDPDGQPGLTDPQDEFDDAVAEKLSALGDAAADVLRGGQ